MKNCWYSFAENRICSCGQYASNSGCTAIRSTMPSSIARGVVGDETDLDVRMAPGNPWTLRPNIRPSLVPGCCSNSGRRQVASVCRNGQPGQDQPLLMWVQGVHEQASVGLGFLLIWISDSRRTNGSAQVKKRQIIRSDARIDELRKSPHERCKES